MTGQKEAEEISWDGGPARTGRESPNTRQHEQHAQREQQCKQGRRVETRGTQQAALNGGLAVWQVGNARGGGK